jgi:DNA-binding transcriptional ArsR family regulator
MPMIAEGATDRAARLFHSLSDPTRLAILLELLEGERRVTDLVASTSRSQATVSEHLACLRGCGLVSVRPSGRQSFYSLALPEIFDVLVAAQKLLSATGDAVRLCPVHLEPTS